MKGTIKGKKVSNATYGEILDIVEANKEAFTKLELSHGEYEDIPVAEALLAECMYGDGISFTRHTLLNYSDFEYYITIQNVTEAIKFLKFMKKNPNFKFNQKTFKELQNK